MRLISIHFIFFMKQIVTGIILTLLAGGIITNISHQKTSQNHVPQNIPADSTTTTLLSEKTIQDSYGKDTRNTITVTLPKNRTSKTPFILFIHGGAWTSGDKKDIAIIQTILSQQGIASAAINYRYVSKDVHYDDLMEDVTQAIDYIEKNLEAWNIGKKKISIGGISAGAHMSLLYAYKYDTAHTIGSIISMAGPTDLSDPEMLNTAEKNNMLGFVNLLVDDIYIKNTPVPKHFTEASPIFYTKNIPTLLIHGNKDSIVLYNQSTKLDQELEKKGVPHKLITIDNANHDLGLANPRNATRITQEVTRWIQTYTQ